MLLALAGVLPCFAQDGKLAIHTTPKQAYVFVDDHAVGEASRHQSLTLSPGNHKVELVNYGYTPVTQTVTTRFKVGIASTTVAVAKPSAELSASAAQVNCGDGSQLKWSSSDAPRVEITPVGPVAASGEQAVQPKQSTTYQLTAVGPGGRATSSTTVNVNTAVQADLQLAPAEVHYKRVGDKVVEEGSTALNWTASNASTVSIDQLGTVDPNGSRTLPITPSEWFSNDDIM